MYQFKFEKPPLQDLKPFFKAVQSDNLEEVKHLLRNYKININALSQYGGTALSYACANLSTNMISFLLENGADINIPYPNRWNSETSALYDMAFRWQLARRKGNKEDCEQAEHLIQLLWEHQPNANLHCFCNDNSRSLFMDLFDFWQEKSQTKLITVDFSNRDFNDHDLGNLADVLEKYGKDRFISELNLSNNSFSHSGLSDFANSLKSNEVLRSLDLSGNKHIGCRPYFYSGFQNLINALFKNKKLESLNVKNCPLDKEDINTLLNFLKNKPHDSKLERIDFDISKAVLAALPVSDRTLIRTMQKQSYFLGVINQCQWKLWKFMKYHPHEKRAALLLKKSIEYLNTCKGIFSGEEIDPYLEGVGAGLMKFIDVALDNNFIDLIPCFDEVLKIIDLSRSSSVLKIINEYDTENTNSKDVFRRVFENNMDALCIAFWGIHSRYVKSQVVTPAEKMIKAAKNIILGLSGFSKIIEGSSQIVELAGEHLHTVTEGVEVLCKTAEVANMISEHFDGIKESIIRKIHGSTIEDLCKNLVYSFKNFNTALSKIIAISHAILHHYEESFNKLSPEKAATIAIYAFLQLGGLLMSSCVSKCLTADSLTELCILYLSYAPIRDTVIRVDLLTDAEKQEAQEFFMRPALKFSSKGKHADAHCAINDQDNNVPKRWATQAEMTVLNDLLAMRKVDKDFSQAVSTPTLIQFPLRFNQQELLVLEKNMPFETELSQYKSKSKEIKVLKNQLNFLMQGQSQKEGNKLDKPMQHRPLI